MELGLETLWALQMLDADGKFPMEGSLSDSVEVPIDICILVQNQWPGCVTLPDALRQIIIQVPVGYALNPGSYESCLGVTTDSFDGKYCLVFLHGPPGLSGLASDDLGRDAISEELDNAQSLLNHLQMLNNNPFPVPNLYNLARRLDSYQYLTNRLKNQETKVSDHARFSILNTKLIVDYITELAVTHSNPEEVLDTSSFLPSIYLALLSIYNAINRPMLGLCIPSSCSETDVNQNYLTIIQNLSTSDQSLVPSAFTLQCYTNKNRDGTPNPMPAIDIFIYVIFSIILIFMISGTALDMWDSLAGSKPVKRNNIILKSVLSFSVYTNSRHLLSTVSVGSDHLDCMNGMRFLSMTWVIVGHSFFILLMPYSALRNILIAPEIMSGSAGLAFEAVLTATPSVDSFFLLSGTLTAYLMFKELDQAGKDIPKHIVTLIMYYIHRYLRLTITYALIMGVVVAVVPHVYYGPGWSYINAEADACRNNWWAHFLYVSTLPKDLAGDKNLCMGVTWYLVDDMLFHWFSPLILYPMFLLWQKNHNHFAGIIYWLTAMTAFTCGVAYIAFTTQQPPATSITSENYEANYTYQVDFYYVPWARYQPYLVGILLGYILHHTRGKQLIINEQLNIVVWQIAFLAAFAIVYGLYDARVSMSGTLLAATLYNTFQRMVWALALSWVIFACVKGYGGPINDFLSWSVFAPLARLTYCSYLFHMSVLQIFSTSVLSTFSSDFRQASQKG